MSTSKAAAAEEARAAAFWAAFNAEEKGVEALWVALNAEEKRAVAEKERAASYAEIFAYIDQAVAAAYNKNQCNDTFSLHLGRMKALQEAANAAATEEERAAAAAAAWNERKEAVFAAGKKRAAASAAIATAYGAVLVCFKTVHDQAVAAYNKDQCNKTFDLHLAMSKVHREAAAAAFNQANLDASKAFSKAFNEAKAAEEAVLASLKA
jgi:hypothetical protein